MRRTACAAGLLARLWQGSGRVGRRGHPQVRTFTFGEGSPHSLTLGPPDADARSGPRILPRPTAPSGAFGRILAARATFQPQRDPPRLHSAMAPPRRRPRGSGRVSYPPASREMIPCWDSISTLALFRDVLLASVTVDQFHPSVNNSASLRFPVDRTGQADEPKRNAHPHPLPPFLLCCPDSAAGRRHRY